MKALCLYQPSRRLNALCRTTCTGKDTETSKRSMTEARESRSDIQVCGFSLYSQYSGQGSFLLNRSEAHVL